jgi:hypothetical protein
VYVSVINVQFESEKKNLKISNGLLKPFKKKKKCPQSIVQRGCPWATLIANSMFVVGVFHCVQLLFG